MIFTNLNDFKLTVDLLVAILLLIKICQTFAYQIIDRGLWLSLLHLLMRSKWLVRLVDVLLNRLFPIEVDVLLLIRNYRN